MASSYGSRGGYEKVDGAAPGGDSSIQRRVTFGDGTGGPLRRRATQEGRDRALRMSQRRSLDGFYHETPTAVDEESTVAMNTPAKTVFLLINTMIGAGVLNVPHVFAETGIALGLLLFAATVWASVLGMVQLVQAAEKVGVCDYGELAEKTFGTRGKKFMDGVIFLGGCGALVSYFVTLLVLSRSSTYSLTHSSSTLLQRPFYQVWRAHLVLRDGGHAVLRAGGPRLRSGAVHELRVPAGGADAAGDHAGVHGALAVLYRTSTCSHDQLPAHLSACCYDCTRCGSSDTWRASPW